MKPLLIIPTSQRRPTEEEMALVHPDHLPTDYRTKDTSGADESQQSVVESAEGQ